MIRIAILSIALAASLGAQDPSAFSLSFQADQKAQEDSDYQKGRRDLDSGQWEKAIAEFEASADRKGAASDGALYWKAYAQNRAGRREAALATIDALRQAYGSSRWLNDAQALRMEVLAETGVPPSPASESNEELKMIAVNSLMQSDPKQALPLLEKLLKSNNSENVKEKALFVLTQNPLPEAHKVLADIARGSTNQELQLKAIRYMGMMGDEDTRKELTSIYNSSSNKEIKRSILRSFMQSGSRTFLLNVARTEKDPELQRDAIRQLAMSGGQEELWQLYGAEPSRDVKREILKSMFMSGNAARLIEVAKSEKDPELRMAAIRSLGLMGQNGRSDVLLSIYRSDSNRDVQAAVLNALFIQQNGKALVELARSEKDPEMKKEIVSKMALIHSKETADYMMEILR